MKRKVNWRSCFLVCVVLALTSCGTGSCHNWGNSPRTEYYIEGGAVAFHQTTSAPQPALDFISQMMGDRELYLDLWRVDADDSDEQYKLDSPFVSSSPTFWFFDGQYYEPGPVRFSGSVSYPAGLMVMDITEVFMEDSEFSNLRLRGECDYADAQRLIKQVRLPAWSNNTSTDTATMSWQLTGFYGDTPLDVEFEQEFVGKSRYPAYPHS